MPTLTELLEELRKLNLPADEFAVFGSGPLAVRGLREPKDLDIIVTDRLWRDLETVYPVKEHEHDLKKIQVGDIEILNAWYPPVGEVDGLIADADVLEGIRFVKLDKVREWKRLRAAAKDLRDIALLDDFLERRGDGNLGSA